MGRKNSFKKDFFKNCFKSNGCWYWLGRIESTGYAQLVSFNGKKLRPHVHSWVITHKRAVPKGYHVRHLCHKKICVRPSHLKIGTPKQNCRDSKYILRWKRIQISTTNRVAKKLRESFVLSGVAAPLTRVFGVSKKKRPGNAFHKGAIFKVNQKELDDQIRIWDNLPNKK